MITKFVIHLFILIITLNVWLANGLQILDYDIKNQTYSCQRTMTLKQIVQLLKQQPCAQLVTKESDHQIHKRNTDAGNFDIHALQTTINDHRTMINYLINNTINATYVTGAISDAISGYHSKTGPILTSWRDLFDLCIVVLILGFLIYYCFCRTKCTSCKKVLSFLCKPMINCIQDQEQEQDKTIVNEKGVPRKMKYQQRRPPLNLSVASIEDEINRYHNGFMSE